MLSVYGQKQGEEPIEEDKNSQGRTSKKRKGINAS